MSSSEIGTHESYTIMSQHSCPDSGTRSGNAFEPVPFEFPNRTFKTPTSLTLETSYAQGYQVVHDVLW